ncbi:hypothetical protein [Pseudanabaena sp. UWO310]|uniref:hypothetical protein n=1 Tax=Pseudanabaena sp. UWO310 TaxID=2480795 RepID=UPI001157C7C6|nr:hypothetical protein [Pseudanabaena sp. UWO310]TYQ30537.1 hypothetical protein PseudUWO310_08430 [Pseudanabaena sp. UWO310]
MSTSEALEKLKDPSKFELLATAVLCKAEKDYRAILHSGLNAQGQPRKSPVDGFCRVPEINPPHFILVEHTIEDKLEKKWLFDHRTVTPSQRGRKTKLSESDDGDLLKAGQLSSTYKAEFPDAKFTVVLTTNQGLQPNFCLEVEKKAKELGVSVDFWDRSRIARFLDTETDGQWLRKEYLGIEAEMLSEDLLRDLCYKSLEKYQKQFLTSPDRWVSRHIDQQVEKAVENQNCSISLLIGNSGSGKSAAAYQVGKKHLETGEYSLWLSENVLGSSDLLENALDEALHDLYPSLMSDAGNAALKLLKDGKRLLLIADDVNQTNSPANLLQKLINWSKPFPSKDSNTKTTSSNQLLICPVWSDIVRKINLDVDKTTWITSVFVGTMSAEEGLEAVKDALLRNRIELTNAEVNTLAEKLGNDPILIGLFDDLLPKIEYGKLSQVAENAIDSFISEVIENMVGGLLPIEYRSALLCLTTQMLLQRRFNPTWSDIKDWLDNSSEELQALRTLINNEKLCRLEGKKLVFRHDRIREFLLVESMGKLLKENASEHLDIFWEPYYAEIIGQAIIQYPQSEEFLQELCDRLSLALVESIRYFNTPTDDYQQKIITILKNWIEREVITDLVPKSVIATIEWNLTTIDSPVILEITEKLPTSLCVLLSRFRNGCTLSGAQYIMRFMDDNSVVRVKDYNRDQAIAQIKQYHKNKVHQELKELLVCDSTNDKERRSALALAGFLGFPDLHNEVQSCWRISRDKKETLPETIWATICCDINQSWQLFDELLIFWGEQVSAAIKRKDSQNMNSLFCLLSAIKHSNQYSVIHYLIDHINKYKSLHYPIWYIFSEVSIDSPNALEFMVRRVSDPSLKDHPQRLQIAISQIMDIWNIQFCRNQKVSKPSLECLKKIWGKSQNDIFLREVAFYLWNQGIDQNELHTLQDILPEFSFYDQVLWKRAALGDVSVLPNILPLISENFNWLNVVHNIWCDEIIAAVKCHLQSLGKKIPSDFSDKSSYEIDIIGNLLTIIPKPDAENLLEEYWGYLGYNSRFIQTAIYVGTPKCLSLAKSNIEKCPDNILIFRNCSHNFHLFYDNEQEYLSKDQLKRLIQNLLPYIDRCDESDIVYLAKACKKFGLVDFSKCLTLKLTNEFRKSLHPSRLCHHTENELLEYLERFLSSDDGINELTIWLERYEMKHELKPMVIRKFILANPTVKGIQIAAKCLQLMGNRTDISIIDNLRIEAPLDELEKIKSSLQFAIYRRTLD